MPSPLGSVGNAPLSSYGAYANGQAEGEPVCIRGRFLQCQAHPTSRHPVKPTSVGTC